MLGGREEVQKEFVCARMKYDYWLQAACFWGLGDPTPLRYPMSAKALEEILFFWPVSVWFAATTPKLALGHSTELIV